MKTQLRSGTTVQLSVMATSSTRGHTCKATSFRTARPARRSHILSLRAAAGVLDAASGSCVAIAGFIYLDGGCLPADHAGGGPPQPRPDTEFQTETERETAPYGRAGFFCESEARGERTERESEGAFERGADRKLQGIHGATQVQIRNALTQKSLQIFGCCGSIFPLYIMAENQHNCPQKFKFFRVLVLGFKTKLAIPMKLTEYFIKENFTVVTLLSPLRESWSVRIDGNSAGLHFADGWERFKEAHRLSFGDFLVFEYVGNAVFNVTIFDKSTCEKDYMITGVDHVPGHGENGDQGSERFKGKTMAPSSSGQRSTPPPVMEEETNLDQEHVLVGKEVQQPVHKDKCKRGSCFEITISTKLKYTVRIPIKIARTFDLSGVDQMLLRDPEGHTWDVKLLHCDHYGFVQNKLSAGWRDFCVDNELKHGDVCVFRFEKNNEMLVQIRRSCGGGSSRRKCPPPQQAGRSKRGKVLQQKGSPMVALSSNPADSAECCVCWLL